MVTNATNYGRSGLSDWIVQRVTAVILGVYFVVIMGFFALTSELTFSVWHEFMTCMAMKIFTVLAIAALAAHAWVGLWTIITDYLSAPTQTGVRVFLQAATAITTFVYVVWALLIMWGA